MKTTQFILLIFLTLFGTVRTYACSCEGKSTVAGSVKGTDIIFSGLVISQTLTYNFDSLGVIETGDTTHTSLIMRTYPVKVIKMKVDKIYKGEFTSDTVTILTPTNGGGCGYYFEVGKKYIVYSFITDRISWQLKRRTFDNKTFWTDLCTRTQGWNKLEEDEIINETAIKK